MTELRSKLRPERRQTWEREKAELHSLAKAEGKIEGKAAGILTVLKARGLPVSEMVRTRVLGCKDPSVLDRWLGRAALAGSDIEVITA